HDLRWCRLGADARWALRRDELFSGPKNERDRDSSRARRAIARRVADDRQTGIAIVRGGADDWSVRRVRVAAVGLGLVVWWDCERSVHVRRGGGAAGPGRVARLLCSGVARYEG